MPPPPDIYIATQHQLTLSATQPCETGAVKPSHIEVKPAPPVHSGNAKPEEPKPHGGEGEDWNNKSHGGEGKPTPPPVVISGAADKLVHIGAAIFGALLVGVVAL